MKVGDLVELKQSVLQSGADLDMRDHLGLEPPSKIRWLGVVTSRDQNALKVYWFNQENGENPPPTNQYVLKVRVVSEL